MLSTKAYQEIWEGMPGRKTLERLDAEEVARAADLGPTLAVIKYWRARTQGSGLSPFALAGISGIPPKRLVQQLQKLNRPLHLGLCTTALLPIYSPAWGAQEYRDYHQEDLEDAQDLEAEHENGTLDGEDLRDYELDELLTRYGNPRTWRRHCTRGFDPFQRVRNQPSPECWRDMKALWKLVAKVTGKRV